MKKVLIITVLCVAFVGFSQQEKHADGERQSMRDMTPKQVATLHTKRLTLVLDLNTDQQAAIQKIQLDKAKARKSKMNKSKTKKEEDKRTALTADEKYNRINEHLDRKIAERGKMKQILSEEQFETWAKLSTKKRGRQSRKHNTAKKRCRS